jgi:phosphate:Na+ symporter
MSKFARENINLSMQMLFDGDVDNSAKIRLNEELLNHFNKSITEYLTKLTSKVLSEEDDKKVGSYYHVVSDIERVGDYAENIMEYAQKLRNEELKLSNEAIEELNQTLNLINDIYEKAFNAFDKRDVLALDSVQEIEERIDETCKELETRHIERIKLRLCTASVGSIYLQTVSNLERVGDHITNVAFSIKKYCHSNEKKIKN